MPRKRKTTSRDIPEHIPLDRNWIIETSITVNGRNVEPGTELKITGEGGARFTFRRKVTNPANDAVWIDVFGGSAKQETLRSFRLDRIATVHRLTKRRTPATTKKG